MQTLTEKSIYRFSSARSYLQESLLQMKKEKGAAASGRALSRRMGFRSPATLSMVLTGKRRLTPQVIEKAVDMLGLKGNERKYFETLAELDSAPTADKKLSLEDKLIQIKKVSKGVELESKQYNFLSKWYYSVVFVLIGMPEFEEDVPWIVERLQGRVTEGQVKQALQDLETLGLVKRVSGRLMQAPGSVVKTEEEINHLCIRQFHRQMLTLATKALILPVTEREITGLTFSVAKKHMPIFKERIRQFREDLDVLSSSLSHDSKDEEVFQCNIQFFPLTGKRKRK